MKKKRLIVYAAILLAFVLACSAHVLPDMIARALITYDPAEIGTAALTDDGDTVFVRMAEFTFGEGDDEEKIVAPGFTVGNAAEGDDPAADVNFDLLTPITKEARLTGTLDKNIYVQIRDGEYTDLYLGELTLDGHKIYTNGANLNLLGGSLTVDSIETTGAISVVSADVTVNSDLKGFRGLSLSASDEVLNGEEANRPSTLTVNGSVENELGVSYNEWMGSYNAAVEVANGSALNVTGDISVVYPVVIHAVPGAAEKSGLTAGGDLSVSKGYFGLTNARAEIGGDVYVKQLITLCDGSYLAAESVTGDSSFHISKLSTFDIGDDITLAGWFDIGMHETAQTYHVYGDISCDLLNIVGTSDAAKITFIADGAVNCTSIYAKRAELDFNGDLAQRGSPFMLEYVEADIAGDVSATTLGLYQSDVAIHGDFKASGSSSMTIRASKLTVDGDAATATLSSLGSTITFKGKLINTGGLYVFNFHENNSGSTVTVAGDITTGGVSLGYDSEMKADGDLNSSSSVFVTNKGTLIVGGDLTGNLIQVCSESKLQAGGDVTSPNAPIGVHNNSRMTVGGDADGYNLWFFAPCTIEGNATSHAPVIVNTNLKIGGDLDCGGCYFQLTGADCEIGGSLKNAAGFGISPDSKYDSDSGTYKTIRSSIQVGKDVELGKSSGSNNFFVVNSDCEIGGDVTDGNSFGAHDYGGSADVKIGGSVTVKHWACVDTNSKAEIGGSLTQNCQSGGLNGTLTVGGDYINLATTEGSYNKYNTGTFVSGKLTVKGDVKMNDLLLNYNHFEQNIAVGGTITANRKTDVIILPVEEGYPVPAYVIEGEEFPEPNTYQEAYIYSVPFYRQTVELTIDGEPYAMKVNDRNTKAFVPVKVGDKYSVTYDTGESAFKAPIAPETFYYPELGLDLPPEEYLKKVPGLLFGGWYDNAGFEGDPVTAIPVGATGDKNVYLKLIECDHAASTAQPTCTEAAVCTVCGLTIPATDHAYGKPIYEWSDDLKQATAKVVCANDETHVISETVKTTSAITVMPTCTEPGTLTYTAAFTNKRFYGQVKEVELPALGHELVQHEAKSPTCTEPGWAAYETCTRCDYTTYKEIPAAGHAPKEAVKENETNTFYDLVVYCGACGIELTRETVETGPAFQPGDVDGDGDVDTADARLALRRAIGLEKYAEDSREFLACDVTGDGTVGTDDARFILRHSIGLQDAGIDW